MVTFLCAWQGGAVPAEDPVSCPLEPPPSCRNDILFLWLLGLGIEDAIIFESHEANETDACLFYVLLLVCFFSLYPRAAVCFRAVLQGELSMQ